MSGGDGNLARQFSQPSHHPLMRRLFSRRLFSFCVFLIPTLILSQFARAELPLAQAAANGRMFLTNLFNPQLDLLPEFEGARTFWIYHDNYLAAKALAKTHPEISVKIMAAIQRECAQQDSKAKILFDESTRPLPFRDYQLTDVRRLTNGVIRTEIITTNVIVSWTNYADLLLLACIAEKNAANARSDWDAARAMWDGHGFMDDAARAQKSYSTYKLALAAVAAGRLHREAELPTGLLNELLSLQSSSGGWITNYDPAGKQVGLANVETTCLCILGIEAMAGKSTPK
jgi:hypothetical protein